MTTAEQQYRTYLALAFRMAVALDMAIAQLELLLECGHESRAVQLAFDIDCMERLLQVVQFILEHLESQIIYERIMKGEIQIYAVY